MSAHAGTTGVCHHVPPSPVFSSFKQTVLIFNGSASFYVNVYQSLCAAVQPQCTVFITSFYRAVGVFFKTVHSFSIFYISCLYNAKFTLDTASVLVLLLNPPGTFCL